jgi:hypothetical protein
MKGGYLALHLNHVERDERAAAKAQKQKSGRIHAPQQSMGIERLKRGMSRLAT